VHRDVSPQNIIVGSDGVSRVLDFGVAKAAGRAQVTREGQIKGKLAYMSPEQIRGNVDCRADVFAVAVCLWEALTGRRLHEGARDVDIVLRVMQGTFPKPSELRPDIPPELDAIIMRGLAPDPAKRYDNARDMALDLERRVGLAPASEIGPWVERFAADALRVRSERIGAMEQAASTLTPAKSAPPPPAPHMTALASDIASSGGTPMGTEVPIPETTKGPGTIIALSVFITLAMIGGILMFLALSRGGAAPSHAPASSATTPAVPSPAVPSSAPLLPTAPSAAVTPTVSVARSAAPSASLAPIVAPRPTDFRPPAPAPAPAASQKKKCDPYTIDAQGHRKYNLECIDNQ
jgi:serine/threonine-protein kinase